MVLFFFMIPSGCKDSEKTTKFSLDLTFKLAGFPRRPFLFIQQVPTGLVFFGRLGYALGEAIMMLRGNLGAARTE